MKLFNILTHPVLLTISFSFILITGEKLSWFYIVVLLLGLVGLFLHSLLGLIGMVTLWLIQRAKISDTAKHGVYLLGASLLVLSLVAFFIRDKAHYNWSTFYDPISRTTLIIFGSLWMLFVGKHLLRFLKAFTRDKNRHLKTT